MQATLAIPCVYFLENIVNVGISLQDTVTNCAGQRAIYAVRFVVYD